MAEPEQDENFTDQDITGATSINSGDLTQVGNDNYTLSTSDRWPGWPGENVFRILIPGSKFGSLIGRKGQRIKNLCEDSKSRIKVLEAPPASSERVVMISAKERPEMVICPAMDGLLRVHKVIIDELNPEASTQESTSDSTVTTRLLAAGTQFVSLIGKQGSLIRSIQETSRTTIRILRDLPPIALPEDSIIEMRGPASGVHLALELVASHLRKYLVDRTILPLFEMPSHIMMNPQTEHNMWAPPRLPAQHQSNTWAPQSPSEPPSMHQSLPWAPWSHSPSPGPYPLQAWYPTSPKPPSPPPAQHQNPPWAPRSPSPLPGQNHGLLRAPRSPSPPLPGQHYHGPGLSREVRKYTQVPLVYADAVIGESGGRISYIRRASGAHVTMHETGGARDEMTVEVSGTSIQVQIAQQLIQNFMAEAAAAQSRSTLKGKMDRNYDPYGSAYQSPTRYEGNYRY